MKMNVIKELPEIKELVAKLRSEIKSLTDEEKRWFANIDDIILSQKNKWRNRDINRLSLINGMENTNNLTHIRNSCLCYLNEITTFKTFDKLHDISELVYFICLSLYSRGIFSEGIHLITERIVHIIEFDAGVISEINEFKKTLLKKEHELDNKAKEIIKTICEEIIEKLKETSNQDSITFKEAYMIKEKSYEDYKMKMEVLSKVKGVIIPLLDKLEKQEISKNDSLLQSAFAELNKLVNNKQLYKMFTGEKWMDCKKKIETIEIGRDNYGTLFKSVRKSITDKKHDMALCFREFVSSFKVKSGLIKSVHEIIDFIFKEQIQSFFNKRLDLLKQILFFCNNHKNPFQKYMESKKLQSAVEMLVLDLTEVLQCNERFEDNRLSLEKCSPVLIGKTLRNYLAHGDPLIDILPCDPSTSIFSNALRFIKEGKGLCLKDKILIGQNIVGNHIDLTNRYSQNLNIVTNQSDMFTAAKEGNLEKINHYINKGADIKGRDYKGWSGLHFAAQGNSVDVLEYFLDRNVSPDIQDINGQTAFHIAAYFGSNDVIKYLLEKGADVNSASKNNWTPLHLATQNGQIEVVKTLLQNKADINSKTIDNLTVYKLVNQNNHKKIIDYLLTNGAPVDSYDFRVSPLHIAAIEGTIFRVMTLLTNIKKDEKTVLLEAKDERGRTPLHLAVLNYNNIVVHVLLKEGADVNTTCKYSSTPLQMASTNGNTEAVETLLKYGANIDFLNKNLLSALDLAAMYGFEKIVEILLRNKASVIGHNECGDTPLHIAASFGYYKVVETLLNGRIEVDVPNMRGQTALHMAAIYGHTRIIDLLLSKNANINKIDWVGRSPLYMATEKNKIDIFDYLLMKGAVLDVKSSHHLTALDYAKFYGHKNIIKRYKVEKNKLDARQENVGTLQEGTHGIFKNLPFFLALAFDEEEEVVSFLNKGFKDYILSEMKHRPLHVAVQSGHKRIVKLLLDKGADCNVTDCEGKSPLHIATKINVNRNNEIVQMLLDAGANFDAQDSHKTTPLHYAAFHGYKELFELLLNKGADINVKDDCDRTALHYASRNGFREIVEMLLINVTDVDSRNIYKRTPLHEAVYHSHKEVAELLLSKGADINAKDYKGRTSLFYATVKDDKEIIELLLVKGADVYARENYEKTPLHHVSALVNDKEDVVEQLLKNEAADMSQDSYGRTALHHLSTLVNDKEDVVEQLLKNEATDMSQDTYGRTVLHVASINGYPEIVELLLTKVTDIDPRNRNKETPLHEATFSGHKRVVELLLYEGADVNAKKSNGSTALHLAVGIGDKYMVELLLEKRADFEARDINGMTPLHYGAALGNEGVLERLIKIGANVRAPNNYDVTPLEYALGLINHFLHNDTQV